MTTIKSVTLDQPLVRGEPWALDRLLITLANGQTVRLDIQLGRPADAFTKSLRWFADRIDAAAEEPTK